MRPLMCSALRSTTVASVLLLSSCADHTDISGTYVGDAKGTYRPKSGATTVFTIPNDTVMVKLTSRHYQYSEIDITLRGCVIHSGAGITSWSTFSEHGVGACAFDVPSVGAVTVKISGGLEKRPPSQSSKPDGVHLSFSGSGDGGEELTYSIDAKPKK